MPGQTRPFDPAAYLDSETAVAAYWKEALSTGNPGFVADACGVIARVRGGAPKSDRECSPSRRTRQ